MISSHTKWGGVGVEERGGGSLISPPQVIQNSLSTESGHTDQILVLLVGGGWPGGGWGGGGGGCSRSSIFSCCIPGRGSQKHDVSPLWRTAAVRHRYDTHRVGGPSASAPARNYYNIWPRLEDASVPAHVHSVVDPLVHVISPLTRRRLLQSINQLINIYYSINYNIDIYSSSHCRTYTWNPTWWEIGGGLYHNRETFVVKKDNYYSNEYIKMLKSACHKFYLRRIGMTVQTSPSLTRRPVRPNEPQWAQPRRAKEGSSRWAQ